MFELVSLVLMMMVLVSEYFRCIRYGVFSATLIFVVFNFVFINLWQISYIITGVAPVGVDVSISKMIFIGNMGLFLSYFLYAVVESKTTALNFSRRFLVADDAVKYFGPVYICLVVCLVVVVYYFLTNGISMFSADIDEARHSARNSGGMINMFVVRGLPIFSLILCVLYLWSGRVAFSFLVVILLLITQIMTSFRANTFFVLVVLFMVLSRMYGVFNFRNSIVIFFLALIAFFGMTYVKYSDQLSSEFVYLVVDLYNYFEHRVLLEIPRVITFCKSFVDYYGYQYGMTYLDDLKTIMPGKDFSLGDILMIYANPDGKVAGIAPLTPSLIGESYINFGYGGVFLLSGFVLYILRTLDDAVASKSLPVYIFYLVGMFFLANSVMLGIGTLIVPRYVPLLIFATMFFVAYLTLSKRIVLRIL